MSDTTPPTQDGPTRGRPRPAAAPAFLPIGIVFLVLGLTQLRQGTGAAFLVLGIVFLGLSVGGGVGRRGTGPAVESPDDGASPR